MQRLPTAFVSCSLHEEDKAFVDWMFAVIPRFGFHPTGPVGLKMFAPKPIPSQMVEGIKGSDCLILIATPRYLQEDLHNRAVTGKGISEMLHVEVGMASMADRPVLAFVQKGTDVGGFLPSLVQYIEIDPSDANDIKAKWPAMANYFRSGLVMIQERWVKENRTNLIKGIGMVLGLIGGAAVVDSIFSSSTLDEESEYEDFSDYEDDE